MRFINRKLLKISAKCRNVLGVPVIGYEFFSFVCSLRTLAVYG